MERNYNDRLNRRPHYRDEDTYGRGEFENFDRDRREFGGRDDYRRDESLSDRFQRGIRNIGRSLSGDNDRDYDRNDRDLGGRNFSINGNRNRDNWDTERTAREEYGLGGFNQGSRYDRDYRDYDRSDRYERNDRSSRGGFMSSLMNLGTDRNEQNRGFFGKGPKGWKRSDERIKDEVCEALNDDYQVDASDIDVSVKDGHVQLSGTVDSRMTKRMAERCVESIRGVQDVQNNLRIKQSENVTDLRKTGTDGRSASLS